MLNPVTHEVMEPIFCKELIRQELDDSTPYFDIPEEAQAYYRTCRPSQKSFNRWKPRHFTGRFYIPESALIFNVVFNCCL